MKHPPKHFAVEIKRSRRSPAPAIDLLGKDRADLGRPIPAFFSQADLSSNRAPDSDFAVPAFLQTDKATAWAASDIRTKEAEQVFAPKSPARAAEPPSTDGRTAPRILPSLVPEENPILERSAEGPLVKSARRGRRTEAPSPVSKPVAEHADREETTNTRTKHDGGPAAAQKKPIKRKAASASTRAAAGPSAKPAPSLANAKSSEAHEAPARDKQRIRRWNGARRNREDAAALPPGQHWKRRLNPRAW